GGVAIPLKKSKISIGLNYFSFHRFYYQTNEGGIFINKILNFNNGIDISLGAGADYRSQSNFVRESYTTILTGDTIEQGYYNGNSIKINMGFTIYWKSIYFGLSCKNCDKSGYYFNKSGDRIGSTENVRKTIFQGGYILQLNDHLNIRIDALLKNAGYESIFDTSVSSFFKNKYYFGFSMRNKFLANTAFHAGIRWKNFWLLGVYERSNRYDKSAFELAAQLQILKNK
ncbi:MAG: type IX secretion system membrane protein PorP/SprF, partial [Saprospiraceae bacterium]